MNIAVHTSIVHTLETNAKNFAKCGLPHSMAKSLFLCTLNPQPHLKSFDSKQMNLLF